jgi:hypothetical protein
LAIGESIRAGVLFFFTILRCLLDEYEKDLVVVGVFQGRGVARAQSLPRAARIMPMPGLPRSVRIGGIIAGVARLCPASASDRLNWRHAIHNPSLNQRTLRVFLIRCHRNLLLCLTNEKIRQLLLIQLFFPFQTATFGVTGSLEGEDLPLELKLHSCTIKNWA